MELKHDCRACCPPVSALPGVLAKNSDTCAHVWEDERPLLAERIDYDKVRAGRIGELPEEQIRTLNEDFRRQHPESPLLRELGLLNPKERGGKKGE